jgi:hypothetical protein
MMNLSPEANTKVRQNKDDSRKKNDFSPLNILESSTYIRKTFLQ